ncbi:hypothetical protein LS66_004360 [Helicobacter sp. MIT 03-1614]|uniref:hypothetical protein n=1 Tax=Helicobacter sp. MIT 03-1614 TaxID=1548147 RepID=UPI0009E00CDD|nr:hypothetical protein [Helicobacter sp. MIT 03-1614]TLD89548.1 hypothetical protein LS66_004360 [Helicobacter sp. MIT 03-1614]
MQTKFNGNYIKRISYYVGIIAFVAYLIIALVMWIMDINKEVDNIVNNAKAELAPLIQWYEKDSARELESIQNLTQESLNALNINSIIHQNLQDIQKAITNIEILSNFILPYDDENGALNTIIKGMRAVVSKTYIVSDLFGKERDFNPNQTYFILHDKERTQDYQNFLDFLESRINNDFSNSKKLEKASLDKIGIYYFAITALLEIPNYLILSDIEKNTCDVSQQEIQRVIQRYELIKMNFDTISKLLDKQMLQSEKQEKAKAYKNEVETIQGNLQKDEKVIATIQSNLKECQ